MFGMMERFFEICVAAVHGQFTVHERGKAASLINRSQYVGRLTLPLVNPDTGNNTSTNYLEVGLSKYTHFSGRSLRKDNNCASKVKVCTS